MHVFISARCLTIIVAMIKNTASLKACSRSPANTCCSKVLDISTRQLSKVQVDKLNSSSSGFDPAPQHVGRGLLLPHTRPHTASHSTPPPASHAPSPCCCQNQMIGRRREWEKLENKISPEGGNECASMQLHY